MFCAVLCATVVHSAVQTYTNRPNSFLNWVLSHWAHFTVLRFILWQTASRHAALLTAYTAAGEHNQVPYVPLTAETSTSDE